MCEIQDYRDMLSILGVPAPSINSQVKNMYESIGKSTKRNLQVVEHIGNINKEIFNAIDYLTQNNIKQEVVVFEKKVDIKNK